MRVPSRISYSVTLPEPVGVTSKFFGPAVRLSVAGVQPASLMPTLTVLPPDDELSLPQALRPKAASAHTSRGAAIRRYFICWVTPVEAAPELRRGRGGLNVG